MEIIDFFRFNSKLLASTFQAHPINLDKQNKNSKLFDYHKLIIGDYEGINFPVVFKQHYGNKFQDVLDTGHAGLFLISDRMNSILNDNSLTGWKTFPIKLLNKNDIEITGYYGFSVIGRCGPVDYSKCKIIEKQLVPNSPISKYYKGLYVGLDEWDGSDFFLPKNTFGTVISSKAAEILKKNKLTNIQLTNLAEIEKSVWEVT